MEGLAAALAAASVSGGGVGGAAVAVAAASVSGGGGGGAAAATATASAAGGGTEAAAAGATLLELPPCVLHAVLRTLAADDARELGRAACASRGLAAAVAAALGGLPALDASAWPWARLLGGGGSGAGARGLEARLSLCHSLRSLDLSGGYLFADDGVLVRTIAGRCGGQLLCLRLDQCERVSGAGLAAAAPSLRRLRELSLRSCGDVGDGGWAAAMPALTSLDASWCRSLTSAGLAPAAQRLRVLRLTGSEGVGDELCAGLPLAEELGAAFTRISDAGLERLAGGGAPALQKLALADCSAANIWPTGAYSEAGLRALREKRPGLRLQLVFC
jgi:hypothetical protein